MLGVDHVGLGVSDMERSMDFWAQLGFTDLAFDYHGPLGGIARLAGRDVDARVVMLRPGRPTPLGPGAVKLVQTTDAAPPPAPSGLAWGEPGICEVAVHAANQAAVHERMAAAGHPTLIEPHTATLGPHGTTRSLSYLADPDGAKVELVEWLDLEAGWPEVDGPQGVNHVAFGATSLARTRAFYAELGLVGTLCETDGPFEPMDPWFAPRTQPRQRTALLTSPFGAGAEVVEHVPPSPDMRGEWGHLGAFDFGIGVRNLDVAARLLDARGVELLSDPQTIDLGGNATWRYVYFADPDDLYVCLTEARY